MRSFVFASAALCLTAAFSGCDAPVEPAKPATPTVTPAPAEPGPKMEGPAATPTPAPAPATEPPK